MYVVVVHLEPLAILVPDGRVIMPEVRSTALMVSDAKKFIIEAILEREIIQVEGGSVTKWASDLAAEWFEAFEVNGENGGRFGDDELFGGVDEFLASAI